MKQVDIPLLSVSSYGLKISAGSLQWENFHHTAEDIFHINKMEDYARLSGLKELPLPHHRKEVYDFIFLTGGNIVRSKGLDTLAFTTNMFFFLPAFQVTHIQSVTPDVQGYYCHFHTDIFYKKLFQKELLHQFAFMHFTGCPLVEVDDKTAAFVLQLLRRLEEEYKKDDQCSTDLAASVLLTLFFEVNRFTQPKKNGDRQCRVTHCQRIQKAVTAKHFRRAKGKRVRRYACRFA